MHRRITRLACATALVLLQSCGGSGGGSTDAGPGPLYGTLNGEKSMAAATGQWLDPITYNFREPGRYTLALTGSFTTSRVIGATYMSVPFGLSGSGVATGNTEPTYPVTKSGQVVAINQSVIFNAEGPGPWQVRIQVRPWGFAGTLTNPVMQIYKR